MSTNDTPLTCQQLVELVTDYLEGHMTEPDRARFETHIALCAGCRSYLEQMRLTIGALGRLSEATIPTQARDDLLAVFRNWKKVNPNA